MRKTGVSLTIFVGACLAAGSASAAPITIDPGTYAGTYVIPDAPGQRRGVATIELAPGPHLVIVGPDGAYVPIVVDAAGAVTTTNTGAASTSGSTLTFQTTSVTIDPGAFTGRYWLANDLALPRTGPATVTLVKNLLSYVALGGVGVASDVVFRVESDGAVSVVSPAIGATTSGNALHVATTPVTFAPGGYVGDYFVHFSNAPSRGTTTVAVPRGVNTYVEIGGRGIGALIGLRVDGADGVNVLAPIGAAQGGTRSVAFNQQVVSFDPGDYGGAYYVAGHGELTLTGPSSFTLVPGMRSYVEVGTRGAGALVAYQIGALGLQLITAGPATVSAFELAFRNQSVDVTPVGYSGVYTPLGYPSTSGPTNVVAVPELPMYLRVGPSAASYVVHAGASCSVAPPLVTAGAASFALACTADEPDGDGDGIPDAEDVCPGSDDGVDTDEDGTPDGCDLCPIDFFNDSDGDGSCDSDDRCLLDPRNDADGDGVCGDQDPCPFDANDDADGDGICADLDLCPDDATNDADGDGVCGAVDVCPGGDDDDDQDGDGTADACDVCPADEANDADGDGVCGDIDPCPLDPEDDRDGDGVCADADPCPNDPDDDVDGDAVCADVDPCPLDTQNDADGDGVCESTDNCPTRANENQADADGDGLGDACEPDDDDDGIANDVDNCPLDANASQEDFDGDGLGDACDRDDDGDGVVDGRDECLGSSIGAPVLTNGCSLDQQCQCDANWKNHGAYVSCATQAAHALARAGKLSESARRAIVEAAASSTCGRPPPPPPRHRHHRGCGHDED